MDKLHIVKYRYEVQEQKEVPVWYTGPFRDWSNGKTILDQRKAKWNHPGTTRVTVLMEQLRVSNIWRSSHLLNSRWRLASLARQRSASPVESRSRTSVSSRSRLSRSTSRCNASLCNKGTTSSEREEYMRTVFKVTRHIVIIGTGCSHVCYRRASLSATCLL
jgi:hypothetical protein